MSLLWFHLVIVYSGKLLERLKLKHSWAKCAKLENYMKLFFCSFFALLPIIKGVDILNPRKHIK